MPTQQGVRADEERLPARPAQKPAGRSQKDTVGLLQTRTSDLATKNRKLVSQRHDLELLEFTRTQTQRRHRERPPKQQVHERHHQEQTPSTRTQTRPTLRSPIPLRNALLPEDGFTHRRGARVASPRRDMPQPGERSHRREQGPRARGPQPSLADQGHSLWRRGEFRVGPRPPSRNVRGRGPGRLDQAEYRARVPCSWTRPRLGARTRTREASPPSRNALRLRLARRRASNRGNSSSATSRPPTNSRSDGIRSGGVKSRSDGTRTPDRHVVEIRG